MTLRRKEGDNTLVLHKDLEGGLLIYVTGNFFTETEEKHGTIVEITSLGYRCMMLLLHKAG